MKTRLIIAATMAAFFLAAAEHAPAHAQNFGRMLSGAIQRAIEDPGAENTGRPRDGRQSERPAETTGRPRDGLPAGVAIPASVGVEPWPVNAGLGSVTRPSQFVFSAELEARKRVFADASSFPCSTCEGSLDFDSWRRVLRPLRDTYSAWSTLLEGWTVGRTINWRGTAHDGQIFVVSETPVGGFGCRQLRHRVTSRGRNPVSVERPGLICLGKRDVYSASETWHEVF